MARLGTFATKKHEAKVYKRRAFYYHKAQILKNCHLPTQRAERAKDKPSYNGPIILMLITTLAKCQRPRRHRSALHKHQNTFLRQESNGLKIVPFFLAPLFLEDAKVAQTD